MPINALAQYLKGQLDGQPLALGAAVEAHIMPVPTTLQTAKTPPRIYIWPSKVTQKRVTMGGVNGFFQYEYSPIVLGLRWTLHTDEDEMEQFLPFADAVWAKARAIGEQCVFGITDPQTGAGSDLLYFAEQENTTPRLPRRIVAKQAVTLGWDIKVSACEWVQGP